MTWQLPSVPKVPVSIRVFVYFVHCKSIYFLDDLLSTYVNIKFCLSKNFSSNKFSDSLLTKDSKY